MEEVKEPEKKEQSVEVKKEREQNLPTAILIDAESKELAFGKHTELMAFIGQMILAKAIPRHLETKEQVLAAWNFAAQLNLPPQPSLRNIAVIEGTPSLFGDLPLALVQRHKEFLSYKEFTIDKDYNPMKFENKNLDAEVYAGVVLIQRKGMEKPESFSFTLEDAENAGILKLKTQNGKDTVWKKYLKDMIIRKARIRAIRAHFADALCGSGIAEDFNYAPDLRDVIAIEAEQSVDKAAILNQKFKIPPQAVAPSDTQQ